MSIEAFSPVSSSIGINQVSPLDRTNESLTTGKQINQAADNPAVQAIITQYSQQISAQDVATQNANSGIGLLQTASGATNNITDQLQQLNELSLQAMNGTYNQAQRNAMNMQLQTGLESINQIAQNTQFNGINLLNAENSDVTLALGTGDNGAYSITLPDLGNDNLGLGGLDLSNANSASLAQQAIGSALENLTNFQSQFGAQQNGLASAIENLNTQNLNATATRSQLNDTDFTRAFSEQMRQQLLSDVSVAMQAQSNQNKGQVMQLLG